MKKIRIIFFVFLTFSALNVIAQDFDTTLLVNTPNSKIKVWFDLNHDNGHEYAIYTIDFKVSQQVLDEAIEKKVQKTDVSFNPILRDDCTIQEFELFRASSLTKLDLEVAKYALEFTDAYNKEILPWLKKLKLKEVCEVPYLRIKFEVY